MRPRRMRSSRPLSVESLETRLALSGFAMRAPSLSHDLGRDEGPPAPFNRSSEHAPVTQSPYAVVPTANRGEFGSRGELGPCCARSPERYLELAEKPLEPSDLSPDRSSPFGSPSFNPNSGLGAAGGLDRGEGEPTYVTQVIVFIARPIQGGGLSNGPTDGITLRPTGGAGAAEVGTIIGSAVGGSEPVRSGLGNAGLANSGLASGSSLKSETPAYPSSGERTSTAAASFWASQLAGTWSDAWRSTASDADDSTFTRYALNAASGVSWNAVTRGTGADAYAATVDGILARTGGVENEDSDGFIELQPNQGDVAAESEGKTVQVPGLSRRGGTSDRLSSSARWSSWEARGVGRAVLGNAPHSSDSTTEAGQLAGLMADGGELSDGAASADGMIELAHRGQGSAGPAAFHLGSQVDTTLALVRVDALRAQHQSFDVGVVNGQPLPATPSSSQDLTPPASAAAVNHSLSSPEAIGEAAGTADGPGDSAASWWSTMFLMAAGTAILIRNPASTGRAGWRGTRRWALAARGWVRRHWRNLQRSV
ncbi:MAG: hypothetical protein U0935_09810 [Pirellulales bacterium]